MAGKLYYGSHDFFRHAEPMMRGVEQIAGAAKAAYGPRGRMVEIDLGSGRPRYTKRGNMIIGFVVLADPLEARGGEMLKLAAGSSFGQPDDGAITTAILGDFMLRHGEMAVAAGTDPFVGGDWPCVG